VWTFVLVQGARAGFWRHYPLFIAYTTAIMVRYLLVHMWLSWTYGRSSQEYVTAYQGSALVVGILGCATLVHFWAIPERPTRSEWLRLLGFCVVFAFALWLIHRHQHPVLTQDLIFAYLQSFLAAKAITRYRPNGWRLGRNVAAMATVISLQAFLRAGNLTLYMIGPSWWPYAAFFGFIEFIVVVAWGFLVLGLWKYSPPRPIRHDALTAEAAGTSGQLANHSNERREQKCSYSGHSYR
ncbi:MAG TPA: hypothetical protein VLV83_19110, partial [Acidobacteriota bacterium]|nr:hypothetical protein [Acidobacteriota bacterium]